MSAQVAIAANYFPAYARIPRKAQRKADEFIRKFQADPKQPSIHYEPVQGAVDGQLRSVRVGDDYRAIVRAPETGNVFILLYIDHHDEAYRWAEGKQVQVHPATGTLQFFDVDQASAAITSVDAESASTHAVEYEEKRLFSDYSDDQLFLGGVPKALIPAVRALYTEQDLDRLVEHLPREAADLLTGLAAGYDYDVVVEQLLDQTAATAATATSASSAELPKVVPEVDTTDIEAALQKESTQAQFRLLDDDFELDKALSHPLDVWRVYLHPSQKKIVRARTKGPLRITGGAGTGKTVVAMHRAAFLVTKVFTAPDDRVLLTTFTKNLAFDIQHSLEKLLEPEDLARVEVTNIDAWAFEYLRGEGQSVRLATDKHVKSAWETAFDLYGIDGFDLSFCKAEWDAVIQAQGITEEAEYVRAVRHHRGKPLSRADRRRLWELFRQYRTSLEDAGVSEAIDIQRRARKCLEEVGTPPRYRSVIVDETQDLSNEALRLIRTIAGPERADDLLLVGDSHQRIYGRPAPLSDSGINIRGRRSRQLRLNYRTTAAICRWSLGTLGSSDYDDLDQGTSSTKGYVSLRKGAAPEVRHFADKAEESAYIVEQVNALLASGMLPEEVCIVTRTRHQRDGVYAPALQAAGIAFEVLERNAPRSSSVRLATMHRVKGLEFPVVFVAAVNDQYVPLYPEGVDLDDPLVARLVEQQERCLLYVATSRARDQLFVTSYGTRSPFLDEMDAKRAAPPTASAEPEADPSQSQKASAPPLLPSQDAPAAALASPDVDQASPQLRSHLVGGLVSAMEPAPVREPLPALHEIIRQPREVTPPPTRQASTGPIIPRAIGDAELDVTPLSTWHLPTRMVNWLSRNAVETVGQLLALDPQALAQERNLGRKSIADTAAVIHDKLGSKWEDLRRTGADSAPASAAFEPELEETLQRDLAAAGFAERLVAWGREHDVNTIQDLTSRHPLDLILEPALGRVVVAEARRTLESLLGRRWEEAQRQLAAGLLLDTQLRWDALKAELPEAVRSEPLEEVALPTRMRNYVHRTKLHTVADLVGLRRADLLAEPNLGRASIAATRTALLSHGASIERRLSKWREGLLLALKDMFQDLDAIARMIVSRRAGLGMRPETLEEIGSTFGVTRERIRQIEKKTWDDIRRFGAWCRFVSERCDELAPRGAASFEVLTTDPWWSTLSDEPDALGYFLERLLDGAWHVIELQGEHYLSNRDQKDFDKARGAARKALQRTRFPKALTAVRDAVNQATGGLSESLREMVWEELEQELAIEGSEGDARALAFGRTKRAQVMAFLERQDAPVPVSDLIAEVGRCSLPDEVFFFAHGLVGLEKHFPEFQHWRAKVAPVAIALIEENGPERQWSCVELLPSIQEELELPEWLEHWRLAAILRRSEGIEYLGRLRVALPGVVEDSTRILIHDAAEQLLKDGREPLGWDAIAKGLRAKLDVSDITLVGLLNRPPFLKTEKRKWGLLARDLPGGVDAMTEALDEVEATLERRQRGLSAKFVQKEVARLSSAHAAWTAEMCLSVLRSDPRFRLAISGNVGLSSWESTRVPSRLELVREAVERAEGRVSIAALQDRIDALYGKKPTRVQIGALANRFGARLEGEWLVLRPLELPPA